MVFKTIAIDHSAISLFFQTLKIVISNYFLKFENAKLSIWNYFCKISVEILQKYFFIIMEVELIRVDQAFHFEAKGSSNKTVHIDAAEAIGGTNSGARPMELLLMGLGGCTAIDVLLIMKKQRQIVDNLKITLTGERIKIEGTEMSPFRKINIHFDFTGQISPEKAEKAIALSMEKYCSATAQFSATAEITYSFKVN
jgi:putative redox protein